MSVSFLIKNTLQTGAQPTYQKLIAKLMQVKRNILNLLTLNPCRLIPLRFYFPGMVIILDENTKEKKRFSRAFASFVFSRKAKLKLNHCFKPWIGILIFLSEFIGLNFLTFDTFVLFLTIHF